MYKINCQHCDAVYIGQTGQHLKNRMYQHITDYKNKHLITDNSTAAQIHSRNTGHPFQYEKPIILATENNYRKRAIKEMIHIKLNQKAINKKSDTEHLHPIYATLIQNSKFNKLKSDINST